MTPTRPGQRCRIIESASARGASIGIVVTTRWVHNEVLVLDKFDANGKHYLQTIGAVWRVQGEGLVGKPKNGNVPPDQADVPAAWLEVIEDVAPPLKELENEVPTR